MTVRPATDADVPQIVAMAMAFLGSVYTDRIQPNAASIAALAERLIAAPDHLALVLEDHGGEIHGMFGALLIVNPLSGESIVSEVCWWVDPSHRGSGIRLLKDAEAWAKANGATRIQMIAPTPDVARFYQRVGFEPVETIYQRRIA